MAEDGEYYGKHGNCFFCFSFTQIDLFPVYPQQNLLNADVSNCTEGCVLI